MEPLARAAVSGELKSGWKGFITRVLQRLTRFCFFLNFLWRFHKGLMGCCQGINKCYETLLQRVSYKLRWVVLQGGPLLLFSGTSLLQFEGEIPGQLFPPPNASEQRGSIKKF